MRVCACVHTCVCMRAWVRQFLHVRARGLCVCVRVCTRAKLAFKCMSWLLWTPVSPQQSRSLTPMNTTRQNTPVLAVTTRVLCNPLVSAPLYNKPHWQASSRFCNSRPGPHRPPLRRTQPRPKRVASWPHLHTEPGEHVQRQPMSLVDQ